MSDTRQSLSDLKDLAQGEAAAPAPPPAEGEEAPVQPAPPEAPLREQQLDKQGRAYATGRRKDAVARVWLKPGSGQIILNGRDQAVYFARPTLPPLTNPVFAIPAPPGPYAAAPPDPGAG